jgi:hypothetical protein
VLCNLAGLHSFRGVVLGVGSIVIYYQYYSHVHSGSHFDKCDEVTTSHLIFLHSNYTSKTPSRSPLLTSSLHRSLCLLQKIQVESRHVVPPSLESFNQKILSRRRHALFLLKSSRASYYVFPRLPSHPANTCIPKLSTTLKMLYCLSKAQH